MGSICVQLPLYFYKLFSHRFQKKLWAIFSIYYFKLFIFFKLTEKYRGRFEDSKCVSELTIVEKTSIVFAPKIGHKFETLNIYLPKISLGLSRVKTIVKHLPAWSYRCILPTLISLLTLNYHFANFSEQGPARSRMFIRIDELFMRL